MKLSDRINPKQMKYAARNVSVLTHPARIEIIKMLLDSEEMNVTQIQVKVNLIQSETSHHLQLLKGFGIVKKVRRGKSSFYSVNTDLLAQIIEISEELFDKKQITFVLKKYTVMKSKLKIDPEKSKFAADTIRVIAHPERMNIIALLIGKGELNVTQIHSQLYLQQAETSGHLALLRKYGILIKTKSVKSHTYSVNKKLLEKIEKISEDLN